MVILEVVRAEDSFLQGTLADCCCCYWTTKPQWHSDMKDVQPSFGVCYE